MGCDSWEHSRNLHSTSINYRLVPWRASLGRDWWAWAVGEWASEAKGERQAAGVDDLLIENGAGIPDRESECVNLLRSNTVSLSGC